MLERTRMNYDELLQKRDALLKADIPEDEIELYLPDYKKVTILKNSGFSDTDIKNVINQVNSAPKYKPLSDLPKDLMEYYDMKDGFRIFINFIQDYTTFKDEDAEDIMTQILNKCDVISASEYKEQGFEIDGIRYSIPQK